MPSESRVGYVLKVYPRFSETFVVTEILAREARGETIEIFSLRPTPDTRFHAELARVQAPVHAIAQPRRVSQLWATLRSATADKELSASLARHLAELLRAEPDDAVQAVDIARMVRSHGITHLHAHFASTATAVARLVSLLTGVPYSFTAHAKDIFHEDVDHDDLRTRFGDAAFAVTVSDFNEDFLRGILPSEAGLHRLYNGLELHRFPFREPRPPSAEAHLLTVGRLVEKKGFDVLIDAVDLLHAGGARVRLDIIGDGELRDELAARISRSARPDAIRLLGPLPQDQVAERLRTADLFVAPCLPGADGNVDGLPTVLLEAMATGVPCISTAVTGIPEVIRDGDTGLLCEPGDAAGLAAAIARASDPAFPAAAVAARARALVERDFDSTRQAETLDRLTRSTVRSATTTGAADRAEKRRAA